MTAIEESLVLYEVVDEHIAWITLNRPAKRNAISAEVAALIRDVVHRVEGDPAIRVAVLASCLEKVFCAGADLAGLLEGKSPSTGEEGFAGLVYAKRSKPWIAAVRGAALAGGCEIVLACDMVVASHDAVFGLPEVRRGLIAGAGGLHRLPRLLPRNIAMELITAGTTMSATRAYELGMVNRLAPVEETHAAALALARQVAANAPLAVAGSLSVARAALDDTEHHLRARTVAAFETIRDSHDAREGPRAFLERREPVWLGR